MRMTIEHPVIVSGTWPNGSARRELVRIPTEFEFREFSELEAPLAFTDGIDRQSVRVVDGKLYRAWFYVNRASESLGENGALRKALFGGGALDFEPLGKLVRDAARSIKEADPFTEVGNIDRVLEWRDRKNGYNQHGIICVKAPMFRNWRWLSPDTDERIGEWRGIATELMHNVVIVGDRPYVRCFEPCYRLEYLGEGQASLHEATTGVYAKEAHRADRFDDGLEIMGPSALAYGSHYFSATDPDGPGALADQMGWRLCGKVHPVEVHDVDAAQTDFLEMETVRHARMMLDWAERSIAVSKVKAPDPEMPVMESLARELRSTILDWQEKKAGYVPVSTAFHRLRESSFSPATADTRPKLQLEAFVSREDASPVRIRTSAFGPAT
ncbi:hypothetical protein OIU34_19765 [Pararhizobium sp. BT-229]|uniref:hypothetical protein n=1 Tax=Pararhizobium sp. BT-229 TaxID=2986923 RepID=UPI0021F7C8EF|nr:hypothetical protein [Pararhizobium sp. BT-229]MCV9964123.1 hypothetical protein [Pararhizobium sp. BT-229]